MTGDALFRRSPSPSEPSPCSAPWPPPLPADATLAAAGPSGSLAEMALEKLKVGPAGLWEVKMLQGVGKGDSQSLLPAIQGNGDAPGPMHIAKEHPSPQVPFPSLQLPAELSLLSQSSSYFSSPAWVTATKPRAGSKDLF